jgi:hypothetical protein
LPRAFGVNAADGWYVPLPDVVAVPSGVPPDEHEAGGLACGPNTVNVIVPAGLSPPPNAPDTDDAAIAPPLVPDDGTLSDSDGCAAPTVVSAIPAPHVELAKASLLSPS